MMGQPGMHQQQMAMQGNMAMQQPTSQQQMVAMQEHQR